MKNYKAACLALATHGTPTAQSNKFVKIANTTEDPTLKALCLKMGKWWFWHLKRGEYRSKQDPNTGLPINEGIPSTRDEWVEGYKHLSSQIQDYCDRVIAQSKPEWMILAERHGWTPPNK